MSEIRVEAHLCPAHRWTTESYRDDCDQDRCGVRDERGGRCGERFSHSYTFLPLHEHDEALTDARALASPQPPSPQAEPEKTDAPSNRDALSVPDQFSEPQGDAVELVVDFLASWRYCPVSTASNPSRSCLEDAAKQLLAAITPLLRSDLTTRLLSDEAKAAAAEAVHEANVGRFDPDTFYERAAEAAVRVAISAVVGKEAGDG